MRKSERHCKKKEDETDGEGDTLVHNMYIQYHKGIKRREPVYGAIANIPGS